MKTKKILSIVFQSIQGLFLLGFILSLVNWEAISPPEIPSFPGFPSWLTVNAIGYVVIGIFWIFLNITSWVSILSKD